MTSGNLILVSGEGRGEADLPALRAAVRAAGGIVQQAWIQLASGQALARDSGSYIAGLQQPGSVRSPFEGDPYAVAVFNLAPHAAVIEEGHGPFSLPSRINWGRPSVRRGKNGPYIIIPFQHFTPSASAPSSRRRSMPAGVYEVARQLRPGERIALHPREGDAMPVQRGDRVVAMRQGRTISPTNPAPFTESRRIWIRGQPEAQHPGGARSPQSIAAGLELGQAGSPFRTSASIFEGLQKLPGQGGGSKYMTFRIITPRSQGWIIPGRAPTHLSQRAAAATEAEVRHVLTEALSADAARIIGESLDRRA